MTDKMLTLTETDISEAISLRHALHAAPELSGEERETAAAVARVLQDAGADEVITGLGGHGVAAIFEGTGKGPTVMLRAELDALPIAQRSAAPYRSKVAGRSHACGHDGHMAILYAVARALGRRPPPRGRAVLLFQPAEEDGAGARAVLEDRRARALAPDLVLSLHNLPGLALGHAALAEGRFACASRGMRVALRGRAAHASQPETGISPRRALARLMEALPALGSDVPFPHERFAIATIARVAMGERAFGISPGDGEIWVTLRCLADEAMADLVARAEALVRAEAEASGLTCEIDYHEIFESCCNAPDAVARLRGAFDALGVPHGPEGQPWRPSEDFGRFGALAPAAMFFLGSGLAQPPLHDPDFDFPDALIAPGARIFLEVLSRELGVNRP